MPTIGTVLAKRQPLHNLPSTATVLDAAKMLVEHNIGALPILEGDRLVGVFSERDLLRRVIAEGRDAAQTKITEVMTTDLVTADIKDDDSICLMKMTEQGCRHLPVVDGDRLVAFLSARDLMKAQVEGMEMEIKTLTEYIHYVPPKLQ
ncbi:MAG TPA: CBS domain-containing protein [Acidobacteriota bacterium]|nr:CBS domain-containing protein [Acidobacteriota bacterium]